MNIKLLLFVATLMSAGAAVAQPPGGPQQSPEAQAARAAMIKSCAADIKSLCDGKEGRELMMCLRGSDKVSADCKGAMSKMPAPQRPPQ